MSAPDLKQFQALLTKEQENYTATQSQIEALQAVQSQRFTSICEMSSRIAAMLANPGTSAVPPAPSSTSNVVLSQAQAGVELTAQTFPLGLPSSRTIDVCGNN